MRYVYEGITSENRISATTIYNRKNIRVTLVSSIHVAFAFDCPILGATIYNLKNIRIILVSSIYEGFIFENPFLAANIYNRKISEIFFQSYI